VLFGLGDCEYTEEPLTIDRTLSWRAPNREGDWVSGEPWGDWSGRGDHLKSWGTGMVGDVDQMPNKIEDIQQPS
jgi:hypothetical protein